MAKDKLKTKKTRLPGLLRELRALNLDEITAIVAFLRGASVLFHNFKDIPLLGEEAVSPLKKVNLIVDGLHTLRAQILTPYTRLTNKIGHLKLELEFLAPISFSELQKAKTIYQDRAALGELNRDFEGMNNKEITLSCILTLTSSSREAPRGDTEPTLLTLNHLWALMAQAEKEGYISGEKSFETANDFVAYFLDQITIRRSEFEKDDLRIRTVDELLTLSEQLNPNKDLQPALKLFEKISAYVDRLGVGLSRAAREAVGADVVVSELEYKMQHFITKQDVVKLNHLYDSITEIENALGKMASANANFITPAEQAWHQRCLRYIEELLSAAGDYEALNLKWKKAGREDIAGIFNTLHTELLAEYQSFESKIQAPARNQSNYMITASITDLKESAARCAGFITAACNKANVHDESLKDLIIKAAKNFFCFISCLLRAPSAREEEQISPNSWLGAQTRYSLLTKGKHFRKFHERYADPVGDGTKVVPKLPRPAGPR